MGSIIATFKDLNFSLQQPLPEPMLESEQTTIFGTIWPSRLPGPNSNRATPTTNANIAHWLQCRPECAVWHPSAPWIHRATRWSSEQLDTTAPQGSAPEYKHHMLISVITRKFRQNLVTNFSVLIEPERSAQDQSRVNRVEIALHLPFGHLLYKNQILTKNFIQEHRVG